MMPGSLEDSPQFDRQGTQTKDWPSSSGVSGSSQLWVTPKPRHTKHGFCGSVKFSQYRMPLEQLKHVDATIGSEANWDTPSIVRHV